MIKDTNDKLNTDNWLKNELDREERVSAWDFDEGKNLKTEHEMSHDSREASASEHAYKHMMRDERSGIGNNQFPVMLVVDIIVILAMTYLAYDRTPIGWRLYHESLLVAPLFLLFVLINPVVLIYIIVAKKLPKNWYYGIFLFLAIIVEVFVILFMNVYIRF